MNNGHVRDISWGTILKLSIVVLCFYILYLIKDLLVWFLFALIISVLFNPAIDFLQKRKVPRVLGAIFVYFGIFGMITLSIYLTIPLFISEIQQFFQAFPQYFEKIAPPLKGLGLQAFENLENFINIFRGTLEGMAANIFSAFFSIFGGIFATFFVIMTAFFLSLEERAIEKTLRLIFSKKYEAFALNLWEKCQKKVGGWFVARILGCVFVFGASYLTLSLFNIKYAFTLGILAGFLNFIPFIGPIITGFLLFILIFLDSITKAIFVVVAFILIQQIENNIITPLLTRKFVGLPPVLVLVSLVIGGKLWGIAGAILCIPLAGILFEFCRDFLKKRKEEKAEVL